jgi:hypothetical protein
VLLQKPIATMKIENAWAHRAIDGAGGRWRVV